jgi:hypothetical protein
MLNLTVAGVGDMTPNNDNASHEFWVNSTIWDVMPMKPTTDLIMYAQSVNKFNTTATHTISAAIVNNGHQTINTPFKVNLTVVELVGMSGYGQEYYYPPYLVDAATTPIMAGDAAIAMWTGVTPPAAGQYQFNITSMFDDTMEYSIANNMSMDNFEFADEASAMLTLDMPAEGKYPVMNIDINASIENMGTQDFVDVGGAEIALMVYDNNLTTDTADDVMVWNPTNVSIGNLGPAMSTWAAWTWTGAMGGEFLVVVNASYNGMFYEDSATLKFPFPNGTVIGTITPDMEGIEVKVWDGTTEILTTTTDSSGYYEFDLEAITTAYNITVTAPYGYIDAWNNTVMVKDDHRTTVVNFDLVERIDVGVVEGTVTVIEGGIPDDNLDLTNILVGIADTSRVANADTDGNYTLEKVIAGTVNVTASMAGFKTAWNDTVVVNVGENTTVNLTLIEDWHVMVEPAHEAKDVPLDTMIKVTFDVAMNMSTINSTTFSLTDSGTNVIGDADNATQLVWAADNMSFTFSPGELDGMETYTIWISTDVMTAMDMAILHRDWMSEFTTEAVS